MAQRSFTDVSGEELKISVLFGTARQCHGSVGKPTPSGWFIAGISALVFGLTRVPCAQLHNA